MEGELKDGIAGSGNLPAGMPFEGIRALTRGQQDPESRSNSGREAGGQEQGSASLTVSLIQ